MDPLVEKTKKIAGETGTALTKISTSEFSGLD
jgi:hypothetical protein